jgi:hypothetical protein
MNKIAEFEKGQKKKKSSGIFVVLRLSLHKSFLLLTHTQILLNPVEDLRILEILPSSCDLGLPFDLIH